MSESGTSQHWEKLGIKIQLGLMNSAIVLSQNLELSSFPFSQTETVEENINSHQRPAYKTCLAEMYGIYYCLPSVRKGDCD